MHVGTSASRNLVIDDTTTVLHDRTFIEEMKSDILRRAEEPSGSEGEIDVSGFAGDHAKDTVKGKREMSPSTTSSTAIAMCTSQATEKRSLRTGDDRAEPEQNIEIILEHAYLSNSKVFERDAATRRSKERAVLRAETGTFLPRWLLSGRSTYLKIG